jgi:ribose 5-phosphate isomerase B
MKNIVIGSDHGGFELKQKVLTMMKDIEWSDVGCFDSSSVDYPDFANLVVQQVLQQKAQFGILLCGSGQGMAIRANKFKDIRAALCWNVEIARLARAHNDANILCLPGRFISLEEALNCIKVFLSTEFEGGRHSQRVAKLSKM